MTTTWRRSSRAPNRSADSACAALVCAALLACSPTLNWRENLAEGTGIVTTFPCRPDRHARSIQLRGPEAQDGVQMQMLVCEAGDATYAVGFFDVKSPGEVSTTLESLRTAMLSNVRSDRSDVVSAARIPGMTPNPESSRLSTVGHAPDGRPIALQAAFFAKGLRIYQAAVVGPRLTDESVEPFFGGLRFPA